jgi:hypothetical protein
MEWSTMGTECYRALTSVTDYLLRLELDQTREGETGAMHSSICHLGCVYTVNPVLVICLIIGKRYDLIGQKTNL